MFICHVWLAEESEEQLAAVSVNDQPHRDINSGSGGPNDRVVDNAEVVPLGEAHFHDSTVGIGDPFAIGLPQRFTQAECPLIPVSRIQKKLIHCGKRLIDAHAESSRLNSATGL